MKTYDRIKYSVIVISTLILLFFDWTWALGWLIGWTILTILKFARERYYASVYDLSTKNTGLYVRYFIFTFIILWVPPLLSFMYPEVVNPLALVVTYVIDRIELYITNLFFPKKNLE